MMMISGVVDIKLYRISQKDRSLIDKISGLNTTIHSSFLSSAAHRPLVNPSDFSPDEDAKGVTEYLDASSLSQLIFIDVKILMTGII